MAILHPAIVLLLSVGAVGAGGVAPPPSALWAWYDQLQPEVSIFTDATKEDSLFTFLQSTAPALDITTVLLQAQGHLSNASGQAAVARVVARAAAAKVKVALMFGWSKNYVDATGFHSVREATPAAIAFVRGALAMTDPSDGKVAIHFDVEPNPSDPAQYQQLADLLAAVEAAVGGDTKRRDLLSLSSTSSFVFASHNVTCGVANTHMTLMDCVARHVDTNVLMDFRTLVKTTDGTDGIVPMAMPALHAAATANSRVVIGLETNCNLGPYTHKISFCGSNATHLAATMKSAAVVLQQDSPELGAHIDPNMPFAIEDWGGLRALIHGPSPPPPPTPPPSPTPPAPAPGKGMRVVVKSEAPASLVVRSAADKKLLCTLPTSDTSCTVAVDFVVSSADGTRKGDTFSAWWGDGSYASAHVTLAAEFDASHPDYVAYQKV